MANSQQEYIDWHTTLFFADDSLEKLQQEDRKLRIAKAATLDDRTAALWQALKQPQTDGHIALLPDEVRLVQSVVTGNGLLFLELPTNAANQFSLGPSWEKLLVAAIVKTMVSNLEGVKKIKFIDENGDRQSLFGNIVTLFPFDSKDNE